MSLRHLDLFTGIGGFALALRPIVETVAYCEKDNACQSVLTANMRSNKLPKAPIFSDVRTLSVDALPKNIQLVTMGFPCQDISGANPRGDGLAGKRSGLVYVAFELINKLPDVHCIMLENVDRIKTKGLEVLLKDIHQILEGRFDVTYGFFTGYDVGAPHLRRRWYCMCVKKGVQKLPYCSNTAIGDWSSRVPQRLVKKQSERMSTSHRARYSMLGNAVIPQCVVMAWNKLAYHFNEPLPSDVKLNRDCKYHQVRHVSTACIPSTSMLRPRVSYDIQLYDPHTCSKIVHRTSTWLTVTSNDDFNRQYQAFGARGKNNLFTQLWYDAETQKRFNPGCKVSPKDIHLYFDINPRYIEWFMGFPAGWTGVK